jgi:glycosyltransferase involved in cell wall biosynthesis
MSHFNQPLLSVVSPVTCMAGRLSRFTTWLQKLEDSNVEVIIVHDYRDAETATELREIVRIYKKVNLKFIEGEYGTAGLARNAGLLSATGKWVTFWDSDDSPEVFTILDKLSKLEFENCDCLVGLFTIRSEISESTKLEIMVENASTRIGINPGMWRCIFRRESLNGLRFRKFKFAEDQIFLLEFLTLEKKIVMIDSVFYHYYFGGAGQVTSSSVSISDLLCAMRTTKNLIFTNHLIDREMGGLMFTRQALTLMKKGNIGLKIKAFSEVISFLRTSNNSQLFNIVRNIYLIKKLGARN